MPDAHVFPRIIQTDRLTLCAVTIDDASDQVDAITASLADLKLWMAWARQDQSVERARERLLEGMKKFDSGEEFNWIIRTSETEEFVGRIGMHALDWAVPKSEIGYWLSSAHTGQGYMREAVAAVVDTAVKHHFHRVEIRCDSRNTRSARIPEALGFTRDALLRNNEVCADDATALRDTLVFSRTQ